MSGDVKSVLLPKTRFGKSLFAGGTGLAATLLLHSSYFCFSSFFSGLGGLVTFFAVRSWLRRNIPEVIDLRRGGTPYDAPFGLMARMLNKAFKEIVPSDLARKAMTAAQEAVEGNESARRMLCGGSKGTSIVVSPPHEVTATVINGVERITTAFAVMGLKGSGLVVAEGSEGPNGEFRFTALKLTVHDTLDDSGRPGETINLLDNIKHREEFEIRDKDTRGYGVRGGKKFVDADFRDKP